jgi:hypothetical protein
MMYFVGAVQRGPLVVGIEPIDPAGIVDTIGELPVKVDLDGSRCSDSVVDTEEDRRDRRKTRANTARAIPEIAPKVKAIMPYGFILSSISLPWFENKSIGKPGGKEC